MIMRRGFSIGHGTNVRYCKDTDSIRFIDSDGMDDQLVAFRGKGNLSTMFLVSCEFTDSETIRIISKSFEDGYKDELEIRSENDEETKILKSIKNSLQRYRKL